MNPELIATLAALRPKPEASTVNTIIKVGVVCVGLYLGYKWYKKRQTTAANNEVTKDAAANSAQLLRGFMNPSGVSWMRNMDGTKTAEILTEARNIADLAACQKYYRKMFDGADLLEDLRQELNAEDYAKFINTVKSNKVIVNKDGTKSVDPASLVYDVFFLSKKETGIYTKFLGTYLKKQSVAPMQYLPHGIKNTQINSKIVRETTNLVFGGQWYELLQQIGGQWKTVYVPKDDFVICNTDTIKKGAASKKYKQVKIDATKF